MAWLVVDKDGSEMMFRLRPVKIRDFWTDDGVFAYDNDLNNTYSGIDLPPGTIEKLVGKPLTWNDDPVEL